jgi:hypothetical protein
MIPTRWMPLLGSGRLMTFIADLQDALKGIVKDCRWAENDSDANSVCTIKGQVSPHGHGRIKLWEKEEPHTGNLYVVHYE